MTLFTGEKEKGISEIERSYIRFFYGVLAGSCILIGIKLIWLWFSLRAKQHALFRGTVFPRR